MGSETLMPCIAFAKVQVQVHLRKFLRDLFILMDYKIVCINFRSSQPAVSLKRTAASLIRETLAITPTNVLKQDLIYYLNTF